MSPSRRRATGAVRGLASRSPRRSSWHGPAAAPSPAVAHRRDAAATARVGSPPARLPTRQGLRKVTHRIRCVSFCKLRRIFRKDLGYCEDLLFFLSWQS